MKTKNTLKTANQLYREKKFAEALTKYIEYSEKFPELKESIARNIEICKTKISSRNLFKKVKKSILFVSHDASLTGAPAVLLEVIDAVHKTNRYDIKIIVGGVFDDRLTEFSKYGETLHIRPNEYTAESLQNFLDKEISVIYVNTVASGELLEQIINNLNIKPKIIAHIHERDGVLSHFEPYVQYIINTADYIIAVDKSILSDLLGRGMRRTTRTTVVYPFIKNDCVTTKDEGIFPNIFGCGTIENRKGFDLFCETISKLKKKSTTGFEAKWIGESHDKKEPNESLAKFEVANDVAVLGKRLNPKILYRKNDIFFMSSREDPFPLVCMEAASQEVALVSFDERAGLTASLIRQSQGGIVCNYMDTDDAAHAINMLLNDPGMRRKMGENAKAYVEEHHYSDKQVSKIVDIIESIGNPLDTITPSKFLIVSFGPLPLESKSIVEGGGLRCWGLAQGLTQCSEKHKIEVTIAYPGWHEGLQGVFSNISVIKWNSHDDLLKIIPNFTHVIVSYCYGSYTEQIASTITNSQKLILDCYVPIHPEVCARNSKNTIAEYKSFESDKESWEKMLSTGDFLLCASEQQKNYYIGLLYGLGKLNPINYNSSDNIIVAPFGMQPEELRQKSTPITNYFGEGPALKLLWFGGVYPWFKLSTLLFSLLKIRSYLNITITIVGAKNPFNRHPDFLRQANEIISMSSKAEYKEFVYVAEWVPYSDRLNWYLDSDFILTMNNNGIENRFAWRTRLLDYILTDSIFLTNGGDPLSDELIEIGLGIRIDSSTQSNLESSILDVINISSDQHRKNIDHNKLASIKEKYKWATIAENILSHLD